MTVEGISTLVTSVGTLIAACAAFRGTMKVKAKVDEVHQIVNGDSHKKDERIDQLQQALQKTGEPIPETQPIKDTE